MATIQSLASGLSAGRITSVTLTNQALALIAAPAGEGERVFLQVDRDAALKAAEASDLLRKAGVTPSPLAGLPISVKDLFDMAGQVTTAGSVVLKDAPPARQDSLVVARLRAAGAVIIGRTNMTEFAFSGLGLNPHYGTPGNPFDRERIPGGSSSGAAVSVADSMAIAAVGSDTGGSVRIPAAFCGLVGFKPTQARVPRDGALPLSWSMDTVGPLARSVACCAIMDAVMAGQAPVVPEAAELAGLRIGVPKNVVLDGMDAVVAAAFQRALAALSSAGVRVVEIDLPVLDRIQQVNSKGGLVTPETYTWHRDLLERAGDQYDPRVYKRIQRGQKQSAADYIELMQTRAVLMAEGESQTRGFDALAMPTVPVVPPRFDELVDDAAYGRINMLVLRNPSLWNFLDRPAISLPMATKGLPAGLMLVGKRNHDRTLLRVASAMETVIA